ncbi:hypothetical protein ACEPAI_108 [Sanghuangporus weigelae]
MAKHFHKALPSYHHEPAQRVPSRHPPSATAFPRDKTFTKPAGRNRSTDAELLTVVAALATFVRHIPSASAKEVGLGEPRPDVPEFLCPALLTPSEHVPPSASATASSSSSYPSRTFNSIDCVTHHHQQQDDDDDEAAFVASTSDSDEHSPQVEAVVRSTFSTASSLADLSFIPTHDDRPPSESDQRQRQLALEDVEADSYSNVDNANANANTNTAFANDNSDTSTSSFRNTTHNSNNNSNKNSQSRQLKRKKRRRDSPNNKRSSDDNDSVASLSSSYSSASPSTQCSELYISRTIPDRYELGNDGRWHKLSVSSSCSQCECECQTSIDVDDSADNDISPTGVVNNDTSYEAEDNSSISATSFSSPNPSSESDAVTIVVPDGWDRDFNSVVYQVPLIVVASLLLAAAVTGAVWFTFFWRRRQRTARKLALQRDLEKRKRVEEGNDSVYGDDGGERDEGAAGRGGGAAASAGRGKRREKTSEEKAKARWARATEQWKAHVRWIHRRRRGRASIVDGMKQRDAAMASGISLARSIASASSSRSQLPRPPSRENNNAAAGISNSSSSVDGGGGGARSGSRSGSRSRSRVGSRHVSSEAQRAERAVVRAGEARLGLSSDVEDEVPPQAGASIAPMSFRARGTRDRGNGNSVLGEGGASRGGAGVLSDGHRSIFVVPQDQNQNQSRRQSRRRRRREQSLEVVADDGYRERGEDELDGAVQDPTQSTWSGAPRSSWRPRLHPDVDAITTNSNGLSVDHAANASSSIVSSAPVVISAIHDPWAPRGEYDRPPPELCPVAREMAEDDEETMRQDPPAYRSRRSVEGADIGAVRRGTRRRRGRRRVRDEKIATTAAAAASTSASGSGYVPSPGDYAPYSSSSEMEDGENGEIEGGSSRSSSIDRSGGLQQQTMHVAVDDKQALARLAMYASAPPPLSSSMPPPISFTSSSHPSSASLHSSQHVPVEPNAPPEPEWERFEDCEYSYEYGHVDSPGAGPGPSTISARSRSASPSSLSASRRSISRSRQQTRIRSPSYSESQSQRQARSAFPAPPQPISSKLAYAPADAGLGLVHPPALADADEYNYSSYSYAYGYGSDDGYGEHDFGLDLDSALERMVQGPSAPLPPPPFSAAGAPPPLVYEDVPDPGGVGGVPSAPPEDVLLAAGASAPPLFEEREDGSEDEDEVHGCAPSVPPLDVVEDRDTPVIHSGNLQDDPPSESPLPPAFSSDPNRTHVESIDRNGVPSAVR